MNFYKIFQNNSIIGVTTSHEFLRYQFKHNCLLPSLVENAHFVIFRETIFHADWMESVVNIPIEYEIADVISITEEEYELLSNAFKTEDKIAESLVETEPFYNNEEIFLEIEPEPITEHIRSVKLKEISYNCNKTITDGFDLVLSDGNSYHFSLTTQDQLNLITLTTMVESGETQIPYHADGEPCKFYSTLDMKAIIDKATEFKTYHTSYYNSLKTYINSMETMEEISAVTYGVEIPQEYQSEVLKTLNK